MQPHWLILTIGAMVLGAVMLAFTITRLIGLLRESVVARLPAAARQSVSFAQPGTFILYVEHPRFETALSHAEFSLRDTAGAHDVRSWPIVFRTTTSGFATVRISVRGFAVERPGPYELVMTGVSPDRDLSSDALIFMRPYGAFLAVLILGIILSAACLIGGLVFTALQLAGR